MRDSDRCGDHYVSSVGIFLVWEMGLGVYYFYTAVP